MPSVILGFSPRQIKTKNFAFVLPAVICSLWYLTYFAPLIDKRINSLSFSHINAHVVNTFNLHIRAYSGSLFATVPFEATFTFSHLRYTNHYQHR